jgi:hypothetical protein
MLTVYRRPSTVWYSFGALAFRVWRFGRFFCGANLSCSVGSDYPDDGSLETMTCCRRDSQLASVFRPVLVTGAGNAFHRPAWPMQRWEN